MRYIYIDLGCHDGQTVGKFLMNATKPFEVYAFDPNPRFADDWKAVQDKYPDNKIHFSNKVALDKDGEVMYTLRPDGYDLGSSVVEHKKDYGDGEMKSVPAFDFSNWLRQFENDYVMIKFNVEGAEFKIINKMIEDGTNKIVDYAFIEWHDGRKMPNFKVDKQWYLDNLGFAWEDWKGI